MRSSAGQQLPELRRVAEVLKREIALACAGSGDWVKRYYVESWIQPAIDKEVLSGKAAFYVSNIAVAFAPELGEARKRLEGVILRLYEQSWGKLKRVLGLAVAGGRAVLLVYEGGSFRVETEGDVEGAARRLAELFCAQEKLPATEPRDLALLFGVR